MQEQIVSKSKISRYLLRELFSWQRVVFVERLDSLQPLLQLWNANSLTNMPKGRRRSVCRDYGSLKYGDEKVQHKQLL